MTKRKRTQNAKALILKTSTEVFAEYGYDGARVDEIARRADIAKALIYYHFEGKADILKELINQFIEMYGNTIVVTLGDDEAIELAFRKFIEEHEDIIRIILVESLKKNENVPPLFELIEMLIKLEQEVIDRPENDKIMQRMVVEFFMNMMPRATYACFKDDWCKHFKTEPKELESMFYEAMLNVHSAYIKTLF